MKKFITLFLICSVMVLACHKKAVPVIATRTEFPEPPPKTISTVIENSPEAITAGKKIYGRKCNRCHDLKDPQEFNAERWPTILRTMIPRARLNDEQAKQVTAYVMANTKK